MGAPAQRLAQSATAVVTTAALILRFLRAVQQARVDRIVRFMATHPLSTPAGTTRNTLSRLARTGRIERVRRGRYRQGIDQASVPPIALEQDWRH